ncbi:hypothetical protein Q7C36_016290 [Tachysurus vachellii]|uniref:Secreted protein n=1 Tax=Tachysurus vachellii TaxID=175792 RepID=A0AA88M635_TACVA|nr:hypothetical protein Q7C36_016290 [Tachysurus vachellii]
MKCRSWILQLVIHAHVMRIVASRAAASLRSPEEQPAAPTHSHLGRCFRSSRGISPFCFSALNRADPSDGEILPRMMKDL